METKKSKTIFIEYSTSMKDQHFMTIVQTLDYRKIIIGRIYKEYNPEKRSNTYKAVDFNGDEIFGKTENISELKNKFKKHGRFLAEGIVAMKRVKDQSNMRFPYQHRAVRASEIKNLRESKNGKEKSETKEIKTKGNEKMENLENEKSQDNNLQRKYKEDENEKDDLEIDDPAFASDELTPFNPNSEEYSDLNELDYEYQQREMELEQIREAEEMEHDFDMDR